MVSRTADEPLLLVVDGDRNDALGHFGVPVEPTSRSTGGAVNFGVTASSSFPSSISPIRGYTENVDQDEALRQMQASIRSLLLAQQEADARAHRYAIKSSATSAGGLEFPTGVDNQLINAMNTVDFRVCPHARWHLSAGSNGVWTLVPVDCGRWTCNFCRKWNILHNATRWARGFMAARRDVYQWTLPSAVASQRATYAQTSGYQAATIPAKDGQRVLITNHLTRPLRRALAEGLAWQLWEDPGPHILNSPYDDLEKRLYYPLQEVPGYTRDGDERHVHTSKSLTELIDEVDLQRAAASPDLQRRAAFIEARHRERAREHKAEHTLTRFHVHRLAESGLVDKYYLKINPKKVKVRTPVPPCYGGNDPISLVHLFDDIFRVVTYPNLDVDTDRHRTGESGRE